MVARIWFPPGGAAVASPDGRIFVEHNGRLLDTGKMLERKRDDGNVPLMWRHTAFPVDQLAEQQWGMQCL